MKGKKGWLMYGSWWQQINLLSDEDAGKLLKALMAYNMDGTEPELDTVGGAVYMAFAFMRAQIDENTLKYQKTCEARSQAGLTGGRPKKQIEDSENRQKQIKAKKAIAFSAKQPKAQKPDDENEDEKENEKENENEKRDCGTSAQSETEAVTMLLNDSTVYKVTGRQVERWKELYPAVEVMGELRKMAGWLEANPKRRKTRTGILRFITSWLAKEQDKGKAISKRGNGTGGAASYDLEDWDRATMAVPGFGDDSS